MAATHNKPCTLPRPFSRLFTVATTNCEDIGRGGGCHCAGATTAIAGGSGFKGCAVLWAAASAAEKALRDDLSGPRGECRACHFI
jgi:hypothetical protein